MTTLLSPFTLRNLTLKSRLVVSPMCQYTVRGGLVGDYHLVHLGRFALGGFAAVMAEATAVTPEGRITYGCPGLWSDDHIPCWARVVDFVTSHGAAAGIQLAHSGRKGSSLPPWLIGTGQTNPTPNTGNPSPPRPSATAKPPRTPRPDGVRDRGPARRLRCRRPPRAGRRLRLCRNPRRPRISPAPVPLAAFEPPDRCLWRQRENRMRLPLMVIQAVRAAWPADRPLILRLSAEDGAAGGRTIDDSIAFAPLPATLAWMPSTCRQAASPKAASSLAPACSCPMHRRSALPPACPSWPWA